MGEEEIEGVKETSCRAALFLTGRPVCPVFMSCPVENRAILKIYVEINIIAPKMPCFAYQKTGQCKIGILHKSKWTSPENI